MPHRVLTTLAASLTAGLAWAWQIAASEVWPDEAATVAAADLIILATISVVGLAIAHALWARYLTIALAGAQLGLAVVVPSTPGWWAALALTGATLVLALGVGLDGWTRRRPAAAGPPPMAVVLALTLTAAPGLVAVVTRTPMVWEWIAVFGFSAAAVVTTKALTGAVLITRYLVPFIGLVTLALTPTPPGWVAAVTGLAAGIVAWRPEVTTSLRPVVTRGRAVQMPPELLPPDVLDAAGIDDRGSPRP